MNGVDRRHEARHRPGPYGAEVAALRLQHLLLRGFSAEAADKIFEAIDLPAQGEIDRRIADLQALGFSDPVKMITSSPPGCILFSYSTERIRRAAGVVTALDDRRDQMLISLVVKPRPELEAVAAAAPRTWAEALAAARTWRQSHSRR